MENYYFNLGNLIKEKRLEKGLNTRELATILNVSVGLISNIENAKTHAFNINLIQNLCKTLDISPLNFLSELSIDKDFDNKYESYYLNHPGPNKELISKNVTAITTAYIGSIKNHSYDVEFINKFTDKILSEINYINDFKLGNVK